MEDKMPGQVYCAAPSLLEREMEGEAGCRKKIHQRPSTNHKLIYICLPIVIGIITKLYL